MYVLRRPMILAVFFALMAMALMLSPLLPFMNHHTVFAQSGSGVIAGTVKYWDGQVISGATITATNTGTSVQTTATTDSSGAFSVTGLDTGTYAISASYSTTTSGISGTSPSNQTVTDGSTTTISTTILLGGLGWIACDSVVTTNCVQSFTVNGSTTTAARPEPWLMNNTDPLLVPVYGVDGNGLSINPANNRPYRELANFGPPFTTSDTFVIKILLDTHTPKAVMAQGALLDSWSYNSSTKVVTFTDKPVALSRVIQQISGNVCDDTGCANQADVDFSVYHFLGASDMSSAPAGTPDAFKVAIDGGFISTNGQHVRTPSMTASTTPTFDFAVGSPHLKKDGTVNTGGFFKVFLPTAMMEYMWSKDTSDMASTPFNSSVGGSSSVISVTATASGILMEQTGISYSVKEVQLKPAVVFPGVSDIGLWVLAASFPLLFLWIIYRWRRRASLS